MLQAEALDPKTLLHFFVARLCDAHVLQLVFWNCEKPEPIQESTITWHKIFNWLCGFWLAAECIFINIIGLVASKSSLSASDAYRTIYTP